MQKQSGFTLSEVLLALALLGIVAAFTIPKILQSQADMQRKSVFKDAYDTLGNLIYSGGLSKGYISSGTYASSQASFISYILSNINALRTCPNNSTTEGCWTAPPDIAGESGQPGYVTPSGAVVVGLADLDYGTSPAYGPPSFGWGNGLLIDWNGPSGPNQYGEDWLAVWYCADTETGTCSNPHTNNQTVRMGFIGPAYEDPVSRALFAKVIQN